MAYMLWYEPWPLRTYTKAFGSRLVKLFGYLRDQVTAVKVATAGMGSAIDLFREATYGDPCQDAELIEVVRYLRGCEGLSIPPEWRALLPTHL